MASSPAPLPGNTEEEEPGTAFDLVGEDFDGDYEELKATALANYVPLEEGAILLEKGDEVIIMEQTLDGTTFVVHNLRTSATGRVPIDYIDIKPEDIDYEPDKDQLFTQSEGGALGGGGGAGQGGRPGGRIVRRSGVSKEKGAGLRRGYRLTSEDRDRVTMSLHLPAATNGETEAEVERKPRKTRSMSGRPLAEHTIPSPPPTMKEHAQTICDPTNTSPLEAMGFSSTDSSQSHAQTEHLLPKVPAQYRLVEKHNIVSVSGADKDGRPVIVISSCRLPPSYQINHQRLLEYFILVLDRYVEQDYTLVYFHHGFSSSNKPSFSWIRQVYQELDRKYKKNLKKLYIVHPTNFIKVMMFLFKPIISYKFGKKVTYINRLNELKPVLYLDQIDIPEEVKRYDASLTASVRSVVQKDSKSVFHTPLPTSSVGEPSDIIVTKQFGVHIEVLKERNGGDPIPVVMKTCVEYLEENGLEVLGIFRRTPSNATVHQLKNCFDRGEPVVFEDYHDVHLAAVLLKLFLRELPEPLLTFESYSHITMLRGKPDDFRLQKCRDVVQNLPPTNYTILKYLISFTRKVVAREEVNKMSSLNMAIVFGPNLIWATNEAASLTSLGEINLFTHLLISHYDLMFTE